MYYESWKIPKYHEICLAQIGLIRCGSRLYLSESLWKLAKGREAVGKCHEFLFESWVMMRYSPPPYHHPLHHQHHHCYLFSCWTFFLAGLQKLWQAGKLFERLRESFLLFFSLALYLSFEAGHEYMNVNVYTFGEIVSGSS